MDKISPLSIALAVAVVAVVLLLSVAFLGGYGALAVSLLIAIGLANSTTDQDTERVNEPTERVND